MICNKYSLLIKSDKIRIYSMMCIKILIIKNTSTYTFRYVIIIIKKNYKIIAIQINQYKFNFSYIIYQFNLNYTTTQINITLINNFRKTKKSLITNKNFVNHES